MKLTSIQVGLPREVLWQGRSVTTGIFKEPVAGPVTVRTLDLDGDAQANLSVHGGPDKAVYAYPVEHYAYWRQELPGTNLPYGMLGENFTTEGRLEKEVNIGDRFRVGGAELVVTQPRVPCYKLAIKFGRTAVIAVYWLHVSSLAPWTMCFATLEPWQLQRLPSISTSRTSWANWGLMIGRMRSRLRFGAGCSRSDPVQ